jgi:heme/copper-type cytochrome/quinol oxidase subunit 2
VSAIERINTEGTCNSLSVARRFPYNISYRSLPQLASFQLLLLWLLLVVVVVVVVLVVVVVVVVTVVKSSRRLKQ